jgi:hypothetical protein
METAPSRQRLPYTTVEEFRAYVLARTADVAQAGGDAGGAEVGGVGGVAGGVNASGRAAAAFDDRKVAPPPPLPASTSDAASSSGSGRVNGLGMEGLGFRDGAVRVGVGGLGGGRSALEAGVERETVMVGPWGALESLMMSREDAMALMMRRRGFEVVRPCLTIKGVVVGNRVSGLGSRFRG